MMRQGRFIPLPRYGGGRQAPQHHCHPRNSHYGIIETFKQRLREAVTKNLRDLIIIYNEVSVR